MLRAAVATPALWFGSLALTLSEFGPSPVADQGVAVAGLLTGAAALLVGVGLR